LTLSLFFEEKKRQKGERREKYHPSRCGTFSAMLMGEKRKGEKKAVDEIVLTAEEIEAVAFTGRKKK